MHRRGFTLIELLVVIAIIAILAAILFPVFARAREKARQASCTSNVKQIMLGVIMYAQDYDEMLPGRRKGTVGTPTFNCGANWALWPELITPYVKNTQLFRCPSRATTMVGIGYNPCGGDADASCVSLGQFQSPASTVKVGDSFSSGLKYKNVAQACSPHNRTDPATSGSNGTCGGFAPCHNMGGNLGFVDGHVKWISWSNFINGQGIQFSP